MAGYASKKPSYKKELKNQFYKDYRRGIEGKVDIKLGEGELFNDLSKKFGNQIPEDEYSKFAPQIESFIDKSGYDKAVKDGVKRKAYEVFTLGRNAKQNVPNQRANYSKIKAKFSQTLPMREALEKQAAKKAPGISDIILPNTFNMGGLLYNLPNRSNAAIPFMHR